jgi:Protein of unknown function (DUF3040)
VPLSEREQRILEEIERNLYQEDPKFAQQVRRRAPRMTEARRAKLGVLLFLVGFGLLIGFFVSGGEVVLGVLAFGAMVGGIVLLAGSVRDITTGRGRGITDRRDRLTSAIQQWEERFKRRYRRR